MLLLTCMNATSQSENVVSELRSRLDAETKQLRSAEAALSAAQVQIQQFQVRELNISPPLFGLIAHFVFLRNQDAALTSSSETQMQLQIAQRSVECITEELKQTQVRLTQRNDQTSSVALAGAFG